MLVEYSVVYLSPGVTDPNQGQGGVVSAINNTVQIPANANSVDVSLPLFSYGFMEVNGMLYVRILDAELSGNSESM